MMEDKIIIDVETLMKQYNVLIDIDKEEGTLWLYGRGRHRTYRLPKHYDETWVLMKVEEFLFFYKSSGANLSKIVEPLTEGKSCYPASYGIGFFNFFLKQEEVDELLKLLKEHKIEYTTEFSQANWVYRIKISKKKANIERLKKLAQKIKREVRNGK